MRPRRWLALMIAATLATTLAGCGRSTHARWSAAPAGQPPPSGAPPSGTPSSVSPSSVSPPQVANPGPGARPAPASPLAVGVRRLALARGAERPLPTMVWYPATGTPGSRIRADVAAAPGRFPLIVLSHGLNGRPDFLASVAVRWAAAGFVVAAPAYPYTRQGTPRFDLVDVTNQPADASHVITEVLALDTEPGDRLAGHLDTSAVAAAGHSAGAYTTLGMLTAQRDPRLKAAIAIAGGSLGGAFAGPATPLLFVHGDQDPTVVYGTGRAAYDTAPWPKAFLTLVGQGHHQFLAQGGPGFDVMIATTTDFLRWALYGDGKALGRLAGDRPASDLSRWESSLS